MSVFGRLSSFTPWGRKAAQNYLEAFNEIFGRNLAKSGVNVTWETALKVSTVLACARVISQGIAQVPLKIYAESADGNSRTPARSHPLYFLLHNQPNPWQTSFEYRETIGLHLALAGRHYSFINRVGREVVELIPFEPGQVTPKRADGGEITYEVTLKSGRVQQFGQEAIWHVRGASWNGWQGLDPVHLAREAIGLAISAEEQHARLFKNGVVASGVYATESKLDPQQFKDLRNLIVAQNGGVNSGLPMIVDQGAKWLPTAFKGVDAQHLEVRRLQVEEVCRTMGVMPIMVGHSDKASTYASVEQMMLAHVVHTLTPYYTRIEQSIGAHLLGRKDVEQGFYAKFIAAGLLRGAMKDRAAYFSAALGSGGSPAWMTQDEVRSLDELNPMGGEAAVLPKPTNVAPAPGKKPPAEATPDPKGDEE